MYEYELKCLKSVMSKIFTPTGKPRKRIFVEESDWYSMNVAVNFIERACLEGLAVKKIVEGIKELQEREDG